jgi:hypothetical protein
MKSGLIFDVSTGTVLSATNCVFVDDEHLTDDEHLELNEGMSDSEVNDLGRERGTSIMSEINALDTIAATLNEGDWSPDTLNTIAEIIRDTGRSVEDV